MTSALPPEVRIGHVHLTVSNLDRALKFYRDALGFEVTQRYGRSAVFLSAGGYHHHIALNTWAGEGASRPPPSRTGLYRSEERRVGKECPSLCRSRWSPYH